jgi:hypothetical protein
MSIPSIKSAQAQSQTIKYGLPSFVTSATRSGNVLPPAYGVKIARERLKDSDFADFVPVVYDEVSEVTT